MAATGRHVERVYCNACDAHLCELSLKMLDLLKALWVLIPIGIYVWYDYMGTRQQKETVTAYFWLAILAIGLAGFLYQVVTTGTIPAPCCGD